MVVGWVVQPITLSLPTRVRLSWAVTIHKLKDQTLFIYTFLYYGFPGFLITISAVAGLVACTMHHLIHTRDSGIRSSEDIGILAGAESISEQSTMIIFLDAIASLEIHWLSLSHSLTTKF